MIKGRTASKVRLPSQAIYWSLEFHYEKFNDKIIKMSEVDHRVLILIIATLGVAGERW